MALTGTLRDFGIADILQLIGQQQKNGVLHLRNKDQGVNVHFVEGNVVKAESANRSRKDLLGSMMVRAGLLTETQLEHALEIQKRTLRRLGDILVSEKMIARDTFRELYQLQTTETLYRLFHWKDGTYEFEQQEVDYDTEAITPIRSENVLMEGFRMVDEWPMVRRRITSYEMTFQRLKPLAPAIMQAGPTPSADADPFDAALDSAFGEVEGGGGGDDDADIGPNERRVYHLTEDGVTVQDIIDRSRLGEFETCKALNSLVEQGYLKAVAPARKGATPLGGVQRDLLGGVRRAVAQVAVGIVAIAGVGVLAYLALGGGRAVGHGFQPRAGQDLLAGAEMARLGEALQVYRLEKGAYPDGLGALAKAGLVGRSELSYPYGRPYFYRRQPDSPDGFLLLPPLP